MTRRLFRILLIVGVSTASFVSGAGAQTADTLFSRANALYRAGSVAGAAALYDSIAGMGQVSAALFYNLGNARFREGKIGPAIVAYERAARLDPTDEDIQHNLKLARLRTVDRIEPVPELFIISWTRALDAALPVPYTRTIFLSMWALGFLTLVVMYVVRSGAVIRAARPVFFLAALLTVLSGTFLAVQSLAFENEHEAIVMSPTVTAKSSPDTRSVDAFVVHEGVKVVMGDDVEGWTKITLADGKVGWIPTSDLEAI